MLRASPSIRSVVWRECEQWRIGMPFSTGSKNMDRYAIRSGTCSSQSPVNTLISAAGRA